MTFDPSSNTMNS